MWSGRVDVGLKTHDAVRSHDGTMRRAGRQIQAVTGTHGHHAPASAHAEGDAATGHDQHLPVGVVVHRIDGSGPVEPHGPRDMRSMSGTESPKSLCDFWGHS